MHANQQVRSLRSHIGIVSQEPTLFATSILDNIKYVVLRARAEQSPVECVWYGWLSNGHVVDAENRVVPFLGRARTHTR